MVKNVINPTQNTEVLNNTIPCFRFAYTQKYYNINQIKLQKLLNVELYEN